LPETPFQYPHAFSCSIHSFNLVRNLSFLVKLLGQLRELILHLVALSLEVFDQLHDQELLSLKRDLGATNGVIEFHVLFEELLVEKEANLFLSFLRELRSNACE